MYPGGSVPQNKHSALNANQIWLEVEKEAAIMTPDLQVSLSPVAAHAQTTTVDQLTLSEAFGNTVVSLWISNPKTDPLEIT